MESSEMYELVEKSLDAAFEGKFLMNFYLYLKSENYRRTDVMEFIDSPTAANISNTVMDLDAYIKGGDKFLREAYGHIPKPKARKIKDYLYKILEDAWKYERDKRPGRKPGTKNKRKRIANK